MRIHIVKEGDTLYFLSKKYNVSLEKIISANPEIANPNELSIGMKVKIPSGPASAHPGEVIMHQHTVVQGDTLWKLSKAWGVSLHDMIAANPQLKNPNALMVGEIVYIPAGPAGKKQEVPETGGAGHEMGSTPNVSEGHGHTGKKNTAVMPNYPQLPKLPEMPLPPKAEVTKPKPTPPKAEITMPKKTEVPKEEVKKPEMPAPKPEVMPIAPLPKAIPLPIPKPEMIKPVPLPLPIPKPEMIKPVPLPVPPMKKPEYEPKKEEIYSKKDIYHNPYVNPSQNLVKQEEKVCMDSKKQQVMPYYDKGMYQGNGGSQGTEYNTAGYMHDKKQGYAQPMPYVQQPYYGQNPHHQSNHWGGGNQPYTTYEHGGYIVNYALVDYPAHGDCGCGHAKPLPYSYMQAEADWKAANTQNAQPMLHPQAYGHNPQYTNYFRPTEYGVQAPYHQANYVNQNIQSEYVEPSLQIDKEIVKTSSNSFAGLQENAGVNLNELQQLPVLGEEKAVEKNKTFSKTQRVKKAVVSSNKSKKNKSKNSQSDRQSKIQKERRNPWIKR